ncbi:MAG: hypothetical protein PHR35_22845 [Kiritimatiellae bacterium]|nr:hypothetical protein [Kiritimatiellia bacterium]
MIPWLQRMKDSPHTVILVGLAVLTVFVYAQTYSHQFVSLDDPDLVTRNPRVLEGLTWHGVQWSSPVAKATATSAPW